jgi:signal transduction histidine kinase
MPAEPTELSILEWALGLVVVAFLTTIGLLLNGRNEYKKEIDKELEKVLERVKTAEEAAAAGDQALWNELTFERRQSHEFREKILSRLGELATREDLDKKLEALRRPPAR